MKLIGIICIFLSIASNCFGNNLSVTSILNRLDFEISRDSVYENDKVKRIDSLKYALKFTKIYSYKAYQLHHLIFEEYKSYQYDSAHIYALKEKKIAHKLKNDSLLVMANCDLIFCYSSAGLFKEACDIVDLTNNIPNISNITRGVFYFHCIRLYSDMNVFYSNNTFDNKYVKLYHAYSDSVIKYLPADSFQYQYATISLSNSQKTPSEKISQFKQLLQYPTIDVSWKAIICSIIADFYEEQNDIEQLIYYKAAATIYDIISAKKETTAKKDLALHLFYKGDINRASKYIKLALRDAEFYNARHRKAEISTIFKLIEQQNILNMEHDKHLLLIIITIIAILLILLFITTTWIYRQMKNLYQAKSIIEKQNIEIKKHHTQLEEKNQLLLNMNKQLEESNKIKDEYIGNALYANSEYINKIEKIYKAVNRKLATQQYEDLRTLFKESTLKKEREDIYTSFDNTFLKLFPHFVEEYNKLFSEENRVYPAKGLSPEMRIFALIRLGITNSNSISKFLNYSVNTVNTYKTKVKNKSIVSNELFESKIMDI